MEMYRFLITLIFLAEFSFVKNEPLQLKLNQKLKLEIDKNKFEPIHESYTSEINDLLISSLYPNYIKNFISSKSNVVKLMSSLEDPALISPNCSLDLTLALQAFLQYDSNNGTPRWAFEMVDAWGKPVSGFLSGNVNALGDPTQCVNSMGIHEGRLIKGKYCRNYLLPRQLADLIGAKKGYNGNFKNELTRSTATIPELLEMIIDMTPPLMLPMFAACWPISCSDEDTQNIIFTAADSVNLTNILIPLVSNCYTNEKRDLTTGDISMISFLSVLVFICILATLLDLYKSNQEKENEKAPQSIGVKCLLAFSLNTNIRKWSSTRTGEDNLRCINGIRFLSMCWVVLGHSYIALLTHPRWNMVDLKKIARGDVSVTMLAVLNATFSVDTFFLLSGTLVSYNILRALKKGNGKINFLLLYIHRYLRLTPMYAIVVGLLATLVSLLASAPLWVLIEHNEKNCQKHWWHNLLYINNLIKYNPTEENPEGNCHGESWYLANDMQFFILAPIIVYVIYHFKKIGLGLLSLLTIGSVLTPFLITYINELLPINLVNRDTTDYTNKVYVKPWCRAGPYLVGIWLGYIFYKQGTQKSRLNKFVVLIGWILSTSIVLLIIFGIQRYFDGHFEIPRLEGAFYGGFSRTAYATCVAWIIYACVKGHGSIVGTFLSWKAFIPLGRLTYATYLVSLTTQDIQAIWETKQAVEYNTYNAVNLYFLNLAMALLIGFIFMITMESPFLQLEKILLGQFEHKPNPSKEVFNGGDRNGIYYDNQISYNNFEIGNFKPDKES